MASARVLICCSPNMSFRKASGGRLSLEISGNFWKFQEVGGRRSAVVSGRRSAYLRRRSDFPGKFRNRGFFRGVRFPKECLEMCARAKSAGFQAVFGKGIDKSDAGLEASTHSRRHVRLNGRRCESSQSHQPFRTRERLPAVGKVLRGSGVPCRCARLAPAPWPVRCGVWASRHGHAPRPWARCKVSSISTGT